ncbi:MAG: D-sedoheptulose 7-phosphate isomerase [Burkholderiaceae bacterium]
MTVLDALRRSAETAALLASDEAIAAAVTTVADCCAQALADGGKILLCGNGGSAADCQHIAGELVGRFAFDRPGLAAIALTTDASVNTAIANDYGYEHAFARQVQALGRPGDLLWAYSTSGNSPNVLAAIKAASDAGMTVIGLTGRRGGAMRERCHHLLAMPSDQTPHVQECHLMVGHALCELIERKLFGAH